VTAYLIRRLGTSIVILIGISIFIFILLHGVFPSPAIVVLGPKASPAAILAWNAQNGFDAPVIVQYWHYIVGALHGNLGYSYKLNQSVASLFGERWERSAYLSGVSLVLAVLIAIPLGIYQAVKRNTVGDNVATGLPALPDRDPGLRADLQCLRLRGQPVQLADLDHRRLA
jgi:peptide/nickel transport system permease protein